MKQLSAETVRLLSSAQVITSVLSAVKELVENSLDAGADNVEVKLDNFGLDKIEVRDNGGGISPDDVPVMGQRHFTSKLTDIGDLASVTSYGFRGEALASLCAVSDVAVTTKRSIDNISRVHTINHSGVVTSSRPSHLGNGTTITATHLFKTMPVRKQYYSSGNRKKDELKKIEDLFMCYGFINPGVRFALSHNKKIVWQKNRVQSCKIALLNTVGSSVMSQMGAVEKEDQATRIKISGFLPKLGSDLQLVGRHHSNDRCWIYVNKRPVQLKEVEKLIKEHYCKTLSDGTSVRHLFACLNFELPTETVDVNLEPDKCKVLLENRDAVLELLTETLEEFYKRKDDNNNKTGTETNPVTKSQLVRVPQEEGKDEDALEEVDEDDSMGNDVDGSCGKTSKDVRKFGSLGDIRHQLREEAKQTIEAFLLKGLGHSVRKRSKSLDHFGEDSYRTNVRDAREVRRKLKTRHASLDDPREEPDLVYGKTLTEEERNSEMQNDYPDQSRVESDQVFSKKPVAEENDTCRTRYNFSEKRKDETYQPNERIFLEDKLLNEISEQAEEETGQRNGGLLGEESRAKTNGEVSDQPTFSLFEDNIFLDSQIVRDENDGNKRSGEKDRVNKGDGDVAARVEQEIDAQKNETMEVPDVIPVESLICQSSDGSEVLDRIAHVPGVGSKSSAEPKKTELVVAEGGEVAWSKGVLLGSKAIPVEPVKLLIPGISNTENDRDELNTRPLNCDSAALKPRETNPTSNLPVDSTVASLTSTDAVRKTFQHAGDGNVHQNNISGRQDCGTAVATADHDKLTPSSDSDGLVSSQGTGQRSGEMVTKSLLDRKGSPGENSSSSTSPKSYYDLVNGTPLKRPQDAYTHFLKEYGPKVGGCFPTIESESMDLLLKETWRELPEEKKKLYETMAEKDQERYDKHITDSGPAKRQKTLEGEIAIPNPTRKKKVRKVPLITNQGFIDGMLASQESRQAAVTESLDVVLTKEIPFSINSLKNYMKESRQDIEEDAVSLVGRLASHHVWITLNQSHLSVLHHLRAEEIVLYRRLMATHNVASTALDVPLTLTESLLGSWSNWLTLLSMKSSPVSEDFISIYTDERLVKNGFKVRRLIDQETRDVRLEITGMSDDMPCYGIGDLQEVLKKVSQNAAVRLSQCRPLKVSNYLKSEAVRISRNRPSVLIQDDVVDLIASLTNITQHPITCLHEKSVFHNFFSFVEET